MVARGATIKLSKPMGSPYTHGMSRGMSDVPCYSRSPFPRWKRNIPSIALNSHRNAIVFPARLVSSTTAKVRVLKIVEYFNSLKALDQIFPKNALFGVEKLPVLEESRFLIKDDRNHLFCANSASFTVPIVVPLKHRTSLLLRYE